MALDIRLRFTRPLTVAAVIPGKSLSRPTFLLSSVETWNFTVVFALHTVSQFTARKDDRTDKYTQTTFCSRVRLVHCAG